MPTPSQFLAPRRRRHTALFKFLKESIERTVIVSISDGWCKLDFGGKVSVDLKIRKAGCPIESKAEESKVERHHSEPLDATIIP